MKGETWVLIMGLFLCICIVALMAYGLHLSYG